MATHILRRKVEAQRRLCAAEVAALDPPSSSEIGAVRSAPSSGAHLVTLPVSTLFSFIAAADRHGYPLVHIARDTARSCVWCAGVGGTCALPWRAKRDTWGVSSDILYSRIGVSGSYCLHYGFSRYGLLRNGGRIGSLARGSSNPSSYLCKS